LLCPRRWSPHLSPPPGAWGLLPQPEAPADGRVDL